MSTFILYLVYGVVGIAAQSTVLSGLPFAGYQFDLLIVAVVCLGFTQPRRQAVPIIVAYGMLYDAASSAPFGSAICSYLATYALIRLVITKIAYQSSFARFAWVAIASALDKIVLAGLFMLWGYPADLVEMVVMRIPVQALIDSLVGLIMIPLLTWYAKLSWSELFAPKKIVVK